MFKGAFQQLENYVTKDNNISLLKKVGQMLKLNSTKQNRSKLGIIFY